MNTPVEKIKLLQITPDLQIGGLQKVVVDLASKMKGGQFEIFVCALREGGPLEEQLAENGVRVIRLPRTPDGIDYFTFWKLFKIFRNIKPVIVHTHNTQAMIEAGLASVMARVPVKIHTEHGREFPDKKRYMFGEKVLSGFMDQMIAVSENTRKDLIHYEKIDSTKIRVINNGIDGIRFKKRSQKETKKKEIGIPPDRGPVVGWCGRLSPEKGLSYLIQAIQVSIRKFPGLVLLLAGEGPDEKQLRAQAKNLGLERHIFFLGPQKDIPDLMATFDLFVLPSLREGLPLVLLEAMATSLPIVATDVGGNREAVREGKNGFLVNPGDPAALALAINRILSDQTIIRAFSDNSLELFHQSFSLQKMIATYETLYRECLFRKKGVMRKYGFKLLPETGHKS